MKYEILALLIVLFFSIPIALAQDFDFTIEPQSQNTSYRNETSYLITLNNLDTEKVSFTIRVDSKPGWATHQNKLEVAGNSTINTTFKIFPSSDIGDFDFKVEVYPEGNQSLKEIKPFSLFVSHPDNVLLKDEVIIKEWNDGRISVNLPVKAIGKRDITVFADILSTAVDPRRTIITKEVEGEKRIFEYLDIGDLKAGDYTLKLVIEGTENTIYKNFSISGQSNVLINKETESDQLFGSVTIKIENFGNLVERNYSIFEDIDKGTPVIFAVPPFSVEDKGSFVRYEFKIPELEPGQSVEITYRLEYWQGMIVTIAIVAIVLIVMLWYVNSIRKPIIRKRVVYRKGGYSIALDIRGSLFKKMSNVIVRDWITPLAKVEEKFETLKPVIRSSSSGTELIWSLGELHKGEEKVINYGIKPAILGGNLKLPEATLRFSQEGKEKQNKISSNTVVVHIS